jgi:outer membrane protein assembly factor BamB
MRFFAVCCVLFWLVDPVPAGDQLQWGERFTRNMVSDEKDLPAEVDPASGKNVRWIVDIGNETHGSPVVANGRVFIGTNNGRPRDSRHHGDRGVLMCFNEKDGTFLWQLIVPKLEGDVYLDWPSGGICSPPTIEGDRVYCLSNRGEVMCLDINGQANGNDGPFKDEGQHMALKGQPAMEVTPIDADILWSFDLVSQGGIHPHDAAHSSVLIDGEFLYLNTGNGVDNTHRKIRKPDAPSLVVLEKSSGRLVAKDGERIGPNIMHCTWSSPALGEVNGRKLVVFGGGDGIVYAFEALKEMPPAGDVVTLKKVWQFDTDPAGRVEDCHKYMGNRKESPSNIKGMPVFLDGKVYVASGGDIWWGKNEARVTCIKADGEGDVTKTAAVWTSAVKMHCCQTPSIANGLLYVCDLGRTVHCIDAATGVSRWTHETRGSYWGSTLVADGKVYVGSRMGEFLIFEAGPEKKLLQAIDLDSAISSTPTAANGVVYIATQNKLYAFRKAGVGGQ